MSYLIGEDEVFLVPNAANNAVVVDLLRGKAPHGIEVTDHHDDYAIIAVQGPQSDELLRAAGLDPDFPYMHYRQGSPAMSG